MLDYDKEAAVHDETRGGIPRARSAAWGRTPPRAADRLAALPDPEVPRADPEFTVHAFARHI
ncbi:hypothetical protein [Streptomyces sp. NPDC058297]|uniref:hypothetical protein n=1 Tax=unclassified Streptomyces TaxID=2593676 RepID=UPI0036EDC86F